MPALQRVGFLDEAPGEASSGRLAFVLTVGVILACVGWVTWTDGKLPEIPNGVLALWAVAWGGKWGQRFLEDKANVV